MGIKPVGTSPFWLIICLAPSLGESAEGFGDHPPSRRVPDQRRDRWPGGISDRLRNGRHRIGCEDSWVGVPNRGERDTAPTSFQERNFKSPYRRVQRLLTCGAAQLDSLRALVGLGYSI